MFWDTVALLTFIARRNTDNGNLALRLRYSRLGRACSWETGAA